MGFPASLGPAPGAVPHWVPAPPPAALRSRLRAPSGGRSDELASPAPPSAKEGRGCGVWDFGTERLDRREPAGQRSFLSPSVYLEDGQRSRFHPCCSLNFRAKNGKK
ncbi:uncharacterized protein RHO17_008744 isoform 2-T4 [Thomomys bottae]